MTNLQGATNDAAPSLDWVSPIASSLCRLPDLRPRGQQPFPSSCSRKMPSCIGLREIVDALRSALFPGYFCVPGVPDGDLCGQTLAALEYAVLYLPDQIERGFLLVQGSEVDLKDRVRAITQRFITRLPRLQGTLDTDAQAAFDGDPAATCREETIACYPGVLAITYYRLAHELYRQGVPLVPRMITELAHSQTGIDIHPGAQIGEQFFIDHGTGVVIGETAVIGDRVRMYQGVTLGALSFPADERGHPVKGGARHPIVEDDVILYAGATILGRVTIGRGSVIGGGVWLTRSVPSETILPMTKGNGNPASPSGAA
jgi:serine O-acetyltransferase